MLDLRINHQWVADDLLLDLYQMVMDAPGPEFDVIGRTRTITGDMVIKYSMGLADIFAVVGCAIDNSHYDRVNEQMKRLCNKTMSTVLMECLQEFADVF